MNHIEILKQGVDKWNNWRLENPNIIPNLSDADLRDGNLRGADLRDADLFYCIGNNKEIISIQTPLYTTVCTKDIIWIGCEKFTLKEWESMTEGDIKKLDNNAKEFNDEWRELLLPILRKLQNDQSNKTKTKEK